MAVTREAVLEALQAALSGAVAFGVVTRRLLAPEQMCAVGSPGLALVVHHENHHRPQPNVPARRTVNVSALVYVDAGTNPNTVPDAILNPILDTLDALFHPLSVPNLPTDGRCTLGGTVFAAMINGEVIRAPGDKTGKGVAIVPVELILP